VGRGYSGAGGGAGGIWVEQLHQAADGESVVGPGRRNEGFSGARSRSRQADPGEVTYVDEKNKYRDADKKFLEVARQYGRTKPGQIARYYAALSEIQLKQYPAAEKNLDQLSGADESLAGLARFQLAGVYLQENKDVQAAEIYKQLADKPTEFVPKPLVLLALADHYRKTDPAEAAKLYNKVKLEFPDAATEAEQGLELLNAKS
jgi:predicted negative regulator of RcsB-dependent stress response